MQQLRQDMCSCRSHSVIHCRDRGAVVCNFLWSVHRICWCVSVMLVIIPLTAADSKYSVTRGGWRSLGDVGEKKRIKGQLCILAVLLCYQAQLTSKSGLSPMAAVSSGSCTNPVFMNYLTVINIHRKLNKKDVLVHQCWRSKQDTKRSFDRCECWGRREYLSQTWRI